MAAEAGAAGRRAESGARIYEDVHQTFFNALFIDRLRGRNHDHAHIGVDLVALDDFSRFAHVLDPAVGAGADHGLIDIDRAKLAYGLHIFGKVRAGNLRLHAGEVVFAHIHIACLFVALVEFVLALRALRHIFFGNLVRLDDAVLAACFDRHVADGQASRHRKLLDHLTGELHGTVERSVHADVADGVQNDVLAADPLAELARVDELHALRHLEPGLARDHGRGNIGAAHAGRESSQPAVGAGVAVSADHHITGHHDPLLGKKRMFHAHLAYLEVQGQVMLARKLAKHIALLCRGNVLVRRKVVGNQRDPAGIKHLLRVDSPKLLDRDRRSDVVRQHQIELRIDQFARLHFFFAAMRGQYLFRNGHHSLVNIQYLKTRCNCFFCGFSGGKA